jgi:hypothetical protein
MTSRCLRAPTGVSSCGESISQSVSQSRYRRWTRCTRWCCRPSPSSASCTQGTVASPRAPGSHWNDQPATSHTDHRTVVSTALRVRCWISIRGYVHDLGLIELLLHSLQSGSGLAGRIIEPSWKRKRLSQARRKQLQHNHRPKAATSCTDKFAQVRVLGLELSLPLLDGCHLFGFEVAHVVR